jgi:hypothetical protein
VGSYQNDHLRVHRAGSSEADSVSALQSQQTTYSYETHERR